MTLRRDTRECFGSACRNVGKKVNEHGDKFDACGGRIHGGTARKKRANLCAKSFR